MSQIQPEHQPTAGYYGTKDANEGIHDNGVDKTGAGIAVSSAPEHNGSPGAGNEVLEQVAQEKGRWFQYVKTKQFWITLLLGQGRPTHLQLQNPKILTTSSQFSQSASPPPTLCQRF